MPKKSFLCAVAPFVAFICAPIAAATGPITYSLIDLGPLPTSSDGAFGINNDTIVVGSEDVRGYYWQNGVKTPLDSPLNNRSSAFAVSDSGLIAGHAPFQPIGNRLAALWPVSTNTIQNLGNLGDGSHDSFGNDINELGHSVGYSQTTGDDTAFFWNGTLMSALPSHIPNGRGSGANAINDNDIVAGYIFDEIGHEMPVRWDGGTPTVLDTEVDFFRGTATDLNNTGVVVGRIAELFIRKTKAALWRDTNLTVLPAPSSLIGEPDVLQANAINENDWVVGRSGFNFESTWRATLWVDEVGYDLNELIFGGTGWVVNEAFDINDRGEIVGVGERNGEGRAFLLVEIPEPTTALLLALGGFTLLRRQ